MTMALLGGSCLLVGMESLSLTREEEEFFARIKPAGFTLFKRNLAPSFLEIKKLTANLNHLLASRSEKELPLLIAIDQEGGRVSRLPLPFPNLGPPLKINVPETISAEDFFSNYGFAIGSCLKELGINLNFAPVVDILANTENESIGDRVFGTDAATVILRAKALLLGMQDSGVLGCLKHFPGQGDGRVDTHYGKAVIDLALETLDQRELLPYKTLSALAPMVMVSHAIYPKLDTRVSSRSKIIVNDILRDKLGFKGVVASDDMNMAAALQDEKDFKGIVVETMMSGVDLVLICRHLDQSKLAFEALTQEASKSPAFKKRLEEASEKVLNLRKRLLR